MRTRSLVFPSLLLCLSCAGNAATIFPAGLEPIEPDPTPPPQGTAADPYPETIQIESGHDTMGHYAYSTGYVHAPIAQVWAAFQDPMVVVDRRKITSFTVQTDVETGYDTSFRTHYVIVGVVTVEFELTWREGVVTGTTAAPTAVSIVYQKTWGSTFVTQMIGSIELEQVTPDVTKLSYAQRLNAAATTDGDIVSWTTDMFASVVARVHGMPLPTY